jgi:hypothetical protein
MIFNKKNIFKKYQPTYFFYQNVIDLYHQKEKSEKETLLLHHIQVIGQNYYQKKIEKNTKSISKMEENYLHLGLILLEKHKLHQMKPKNFFEKKLLQSIQLQKNVALFFLLHETMKKQKKMEFEFNEKSVIEEIEKIAIENDLTQITILPDTPKTEMGSIPKSKVLDISPKFINTIMQKHLEKHLSPNQVINRIQWMKKVNKIHRYFKRPIEIEREKFMVIPIFLKPKLNPYQKVKKKVLSPQEILTNIHALRNQYNILSDDTTFHYQPIEKGLLVEIPNKPFIKT